MSESKDGYIGVPEAAEYLGVSADWVYEKAAAGELPSYKFGGHRKFKRSELDEYVAAHRSGPAGRPSPVRPA